MLLAFEVALAMLFVSAVGGVIGLLTGILLAYAGSRKAIDSMRASAKEILERNRADHASALTEAAKQYDTLVLAYRDLHAKLAAVAPVSGAPN